MMFGIEGKIDGASFKERLLTPGPEQLIGWKQVKSGWLFAEGSGRRQDRERGRLFSDGNNGRAEGSDSKEKDERFFGHLGLVSEDSNRWVNFMLLREHDSIHKDFPFSGTFLVKQG